jgi:hypothetical protein
MPKRRRRILEMWNQCARAELLPGTDPVTREAMKHFFFAGAMGMYSIVSCADVDYDVENVVLDVKAELGEHAKKLEEAAILAGVPVVRVRS